MPFLATLLAISLIWADDLKGRAVKELESLQGEWAAVSFEANGEAVPVAQAAWKAVVTGSRVSVRFGLVSLDGNLVLDVGGKQPAFDITKTTGQVHWPPVTGLDFAPGSLDIATIYKREGNRLTVCFRFGKTRPSEFRTRSAVDTMILIFERGKR
jgi:uncharacterized protein (TIGR03067 family)